MPEALSTEDIIPTSDSERVIRKIVQIIHSSLDIDDIFHQIVTSLGRYLQADRCFITRYDSQRNKLFPPAREYRSSVEIDSMLKADTDLWAGLENFARSICRTEVPLDFSQPDQGISSEVQALLGHIRVQSGLGCAIAYQGQCMAVLFIHQVNNPRNWTDKEKEVVQVVASQAAVALHHAEITQNLRTRSHRQELVAQLNRKALSDHSLDELFSDTVQLVTDTLNLQYCKIIQQIPGTGNYLYFRKVAGFDPALVGQTFNPGMEPHAAYTLKSLEPIIVEDIYQETRFSPSPLHFEYGLTSGVSVVIYGSDKPFGVLEADSKEKRLFEQEDIEFLQSLANLLGIVIERKQVEKALARSERQYEVTFQKAGVGIAHVSNNGQWLHLNDRYCEILGYSFEELKQMTFQELTYPEDLPTELALSRQLLKREINYYTIEKRYIRKDGSLLWVNLTCSIAWDDEGKFEYMVAVAKDINAKKIIGEELAVNMRKLEQSNRDLDQFAMVASHDLQAPLRKIRTFFDMIQAADKDRLSPDSLHLMRRVDASIDTMQTLIADLLKLSQFSKEPAERKSVDLAEVMRQVTRNLEDRIQAKGARIESGKLVTVVGDQTQLTQLLQNLLENGIKYQPVGQVPVIRVESECMDDQFCQITVQDNGIGFKQTYAEEIFQPFKRLHGKSGAYSGTGVGLAICQRIVDRHGGSIEASSKEGEGARFLIRLPIHLPAPAVSEHGFSDL